jgi:hypothetical protein
LPGGKSKFTISIGHESLLWLISAHYPEEVNKNLFW